MSAIHDVDPNELVWNVAYGNTIIPIVTFDDNGNEVHCFDVLDPLPPSMPLVHFEDEEIPF